MTLFETIKIDQGQIFNLDYHEQRLNRSRKILFNSTDYLKLKDHLAPPDNHQLFRCKVTYAENILEVNYYPYQVVPITSFKIIEADLDYAHKYLDRRQIDQLFSLKGTCEEIIIIKDGLVTDTSKANIAVWHNQAWLTPGEPLLPGITRQRLLENKALTVADISVEQLLGSERIALMNAMIDFMVVENASYQL